MKLNISKKLENVIDNIRLMKHISPKGIPRHNLLTLKTIVAEITADIYLKILNSFLSDYSCDKVKEMKVKLEEIKENRRIFDNSDSIRNIDGIKFIGRNDESLQKLINYYQECKERAGNNLLVSNLGMANCIITDVSPMWDDDCSYTLYSDRRFPTFICFSKHDINSRNYFAFIHEVGHFYDRDRNMKKIISMIKKLDIDKDKIDLYLERANDSMNELFYMTFNQITSSNSIKEMIRSDYKKESEEENLFEQEIYYATTCNRIVNLVMNKVYYDEGIVFDIINSVGAIKKIDFLDAHSLDGHSSSYYSFLPHTTAEIFANFTTLFNLGLDKKLDDVFPKEFRENMTKIYSDTVFKCDEVKSDSSENGKLYRKYK